MSKTLFARWRRNFLAGFAVLLPALITLAIVKWLFTTTASVTDVLLLPLKFILPEHHIYRSGGEYFWYWSFLALVLAVVLISIVGWLARYYVGKRVIAWVDTTMLRVPLLNKIYATIKQVNQAFTSGKKSSFKTVVLVEFPGPGMHSIGFITSEEHGEVQARLGAKNLCVFIPLTPNPTSGFLVFLPEEKITKLDMSVAEGIKYVISLGAVSPDYTPRGGDRSESLMP
jgi:uncharacterized membrane protein